MINPIEQGCTGSRRLRIFSLGWFVECVRYAGLILAGSRMLFRPSLLVGCQNGLFLSGPESELVGPHSLAVEMNRGEEIVLW